MLFVAAPTVTECLVVVPDAAIATFTGSVLAKYFLPLTKAAGAPGAEEASSAHSIYHCRQSSLSPSLHIRDAEPEDFDDLRPVFNAQSDVLESRYGGDYFYLAEIIKAASGGSGGDGGGGGGAAGGSASASASNTIRCLVAEVDGKAVGMMALSSEVDVAVLRSGFDIAFISPPRADSAGKGEEWKTSRERNGLPSCVAITLFCIDPQVRVDIN